jgi:hypothetical protein
MSMGVLAGIQGASIQVTQGTVPFGEKGCVWANASDGLEPSDLYEAQLGLRLKTIEETRKEGRP